ncbi:hypothetical protein BH09PAT2_BH09PAT2_05040 [soil metagenome]
MSEKPYSNSEQNWFTEENIDRIATQLDTYLNTPLYTHGLPQDKWTDYSDRIVLSNFPMATALVNRLDTELAELSDPKYFLARNMAIEATLAQVPILADADQLPARRRLFYKKGRNFEAHATNTLNTIPLEDPKRAQYFYQAIEAYTEADLITGYLTDYAMRVAECSGGAGLMEVHNALINKIFGSNATIVSPASDASTKIMVQDLIKKSRPLIVGNSNIKGGWQDDMPPSGSN